MFCIFENAQVGDNPCVDNILRCRQSKSSLRALLETRDRRGQFLCFVEDDLCVHENLFTRIRQ